LFASVTLDATLHSRDGMIISHHRVTRDRSFVSG
jgi:hypothetical protein